MRMDLVRSLNPGKRMMVYMSRNIYRSSQSWITPSRNGHENIAAGLKFASLGSRYPVFRAIVMMFDIELLFEV